MAQIDVLVPLRDIPVNSDELLSIQRNNPECFLIVLLIDERPEEVTEMERCAISLRVQAMIKLPLL